MIVGESLPFIRDYVKTLNEILKQKNPGFELTKIQVAWLNFVLLGILVTNSVCWAKMKRFSLGVYQDKAISWMFRRAKIMWSCLLLASTKAVLERYNIKDIHLELDDSDHQRAKSTTKIAKTHKIYDKKSGGYFNRQSVIFLLLVSREITLPVGFEFYEPNPKMVAYSKEEERLRKAGVKKQFRPTMPEKDSRYPSKTELGVKLISQFKDNFPEVKIRSISADTLYGTKEFVAAVRKLTDAQVITQIKSNQIIIVNNQEVVVSEFFKQYQGKTKIVTLRGKEKQITYVSAKFKVKAHNQKYYVIALKYDDEADYRYLIAADMSWQDIDIIQAYALRWLVEVFFQDWKSYEGWNQLAKQPGIDGAVKGLTLSLLVDHALLLHPEQTTLFKTHSPAATVGSLREKVMMESLLSFIAQIVNSEMPKEAFVQLVDNVSEIFGLKSSIKHMRHLNEEFDEIGSNNMAMLQEA